VSSHLGEHADFLLIVIVVHLCQSLERLLYAFALHSAALEELEADLLRECLAIVRVDNLSRLQVTLVGNDDASEAAALVLLLDLVVPSAQEIE